MHINSIYTYSSLRESEEWGGCGWAFFDPPLGPSNGENDEVCNGSKILPWEGNKPCLSNGGSPVLNIWPGKQKKRHKDKEVTLEFLSKTLFKETVTVNSQLEVDL